MLKKHWVAGLFVLAGIIYLFLCLDGPIIADSGSTAPLIFQNAGTGIGVAPIFNCSTGMNCSKSGNVINATATGSGGSVTSVTCGTGLTGGTITTTGTCAIDPNSQVRSFGAAFDGGGSALSVGKATYITVPFGCTITGYNITGDTGTFSLDVWKVATGTAIPTVANSILTGGFIALASGTALHSTSTALFTTTTVTAFDIVGVEIEAVSGTTEISLVIPCNAT